VADPFAGSRACAECHPGEAAIASRSGHAHTLRASVRDELGRRLHGAVVTDPDWPEVAWSYAFRNQQLQITRSEAGSAEQWVVDYTFGSGAHAETFVSILDAGIPSVFEHRLTFYTHREALGITPGHETRPMPPGLTPKGGQLPAAVARECFRCHATEISAADDRRLDFATMIPNVSCERCHGPGKAHIAAARQNPLEPELSVPFGPGHWTAETLISLCGSCHRHPSGSSPARISPDDPTLVRFQPVGILESACYRKSDGALSCVTCHDPHARTSRDRLSYKRTCLSCHVSRTEAPPRPDLVSNERASPRSAGRVCSVSPDGDCVACHMPRIDVGQGILFSDHWIRRRGAASGQPRPAPSLKLGHVIPLGP
jgi:hypothetical protein